MSHADRIETTKTPPVGAARRIELKSVFKLWPVRLTLIAATTCAVANAAQPEEPASAPQQSGEADAIAVRVQTAPTLDGRLDDEVWQRAAQTGGFGQVIPNDGVPPNFLTTFRVVYTADAIYIGIEAQDPEPASVVAKNGRRDGFTGGDDEVLVTLDTDGDGRSGYSFGVTAGGSRTDGLIERGSFIGADWDGIWDAETSRTQTGWVAEIEIPFKTIALDSEAEAWGINIRRIVARTDEISYWRGAQRDISVFNLARAGRLAGIEDIDQGLGLSVKPYATMQYREADDDLDTDAGLDLFYRLTSSVTAALTINTDFAETEVDDRIVNLTRFPLFFPERRDFFLEDAGVFGFGGIRQSPLPFFSRRIGIVGGEEREILAGVRVTGRVGDVRLGVLNVQMKEDDALGDKNLSVLRLVRDLGEESSIGFIATNGDPAERGTNHLAGVDLSLRDSNAFGGEGSVQADFWAQASYSDPGGRDVENSDPTAVGMNVGFNKDPWNLSLFLARMGEDYDPALGFVSRAGRYEWSIRGGYRWDDPFGSELVRDINISTNARGQSLISNGQVEDITASPVRLTVTNNAGDAVSFGPRVYVDQLFSSFEIVDGVIVPEGNYDTASAWFELETSQARPVSVEVESEYRSFFGGHRLDAELGLGFRPTPGFTLTGEYAYNDIDLPQGEFIVRVARARASVQFNPDLSWDNTIQWDNQSDQAGWNSRVKWEYAPGQELILVYNQGFDVDDGSFTSREYTTTLKASLTFRF
ncbi:MAG: hypothetical protein ACI89L_001031 [Phycisphaerales bacterium]|jgi:hypothetical protein